MQIELINIGNSKGFRIPAKVLEDFAGVKTFSLEVDAEADALVITPKKKVKKRKSMKYWEDAYKKDPPTKKDEIVFKDIEHEFDENEWTW